ncbi:DUF2336 domain-containing protein [uncultured Methylobacterium sp.]|uniref:DUF2336 domain-containing protein n=1 Tax=uncultured Methylobacterium sp. TaxID=157278 RepID=UPI002595B962|nr:DUF2336 domain-containing protein [uncultured Methylobacterium sp.]
MASSVGAPDALDTVLAGVSAPSVLSTALKLARQFHGQLAPNAVPIYDEALLRLARVARIEERVQLSHRLAPLEAGPVLTVSDLALDLDPEVAVPVLRRSTLVSECDLLTVSRTRSEVHLAAIAERPDLPHSVRKGIVARGSDAVRRRLATHGCPPARAFVDRTRSQTLSRPAPGGSMPASERMMKGARHDDQPCSPPRGSPAPRIVTRASCAAAGKESYTRAALLAAEARVDASTSSQPLTPAVAAHWVRSDQLVDGLVAIARLADEDPVTLIEALMLTDRRSDRPLLAMRAADIDWRTVEQIARALDNGFGHERAMWSLDLARHRESYERLPGGVAQQALRALRARGDLRVVGGTDTRASPANRRTIRRREEAREPISR